MSYIGTIIITYDHTLVGSSDLTNFPAPFFGTQANLATVVNGGFVTNSSGYDIVVTSDLAGSTIMDFELANYNAVTGQFEIWVRIPTLSHTVDTVIYIKFGNSSISTDQSNKHAVWDTNYKLVSHLGSPTSLNLSDSTSNSNNGTNNGGTAVAGIIIGGVDLVGASSEYIDYGNAGSLSFIQDNQTIEAWIYIPAAQNVKWVLFKGIQGAVPNTGFYITNASSSLQVNYRTTNSFGNPDDLGSGNLTFNNWHYIVGTCNGGTVKTLYVDGVSVGSNSATTNGVPSGGPFRVGCDSSASLVPADFISGNIDEPRFSNIARSPDWILATYNFIINTPAIIIRFGSGFVVNNPL